ncbi:AsmA family protein [Noviherbaspirillum pedocola]|uniref:AsmA family protein n=1 Tax=Noviherbaspirillum pedocola TaxID=2801341 RepID=A0A934SW00_9BURK|nr:AsmA family protein [Noviherbaspirillum pedocola]MBK4736415.1 AsmA family protein [Noviherbaspirillum pedocola]
MNKAFKIIGYTLGGIVCLLALTLALLSFVDLNRARPWLSEKVSDATGRSFAINGDLSLSWERPPQEKGWRRFVPWPHLRAKDIELGNPDWATTGPDMARIAQVDFNINPLALLKKTVSVSSLIMTEPNLALEEDKKGRTNWNFAKKDDKESPKGQSGWKFELHDLAITRGTIRYVDAGKKADMRIRIDTNEDNSVSWKLAGSFNGEKITGKAQTGELLSLQAQGVKYPVKAEVEVGETVITADGTLTDPSHPSAVDVKVNIHGASMADLFPISGVLLPRTPKFSTEGRLVGTLGRGNLNLRYENFKGRVGSSDIGGTLAYEQKQPRPLLHGEVVSNRLDIRDLEVLVGSGDKKQKPGEPKQPPNKVLPVAPFNTDRWGKMDADVTFSGKEIIHGDRLPLDNLRTHVRMDNGVLALAPLDFGIAGGRLTTELNINGGSDPAKARMKVSARSIRIKELFPKVESMHASVGKIQGDAQLSATGNSFAALAASANGEVKALISQGTVSEFIMEAIGLNVARAVTVKLFGDKQVKLNCMAADLDAKNGVLTPKVFLLDTEDAIVNVDGNVNLAKETMDLDIRPKSKGLRFITLRSPLYVRGTFKDPDVGVNKGVLALRAGAAVALGAIAAPLAGLAALTQPDRDEDAACNTLLAQAGEKPVAPPPGKTAATHHSAKSAR